MTEEYLFTQIRLSIEESKKKKSAGQIIVTVDMNNGGITRGRIQVETVLLQPPQPESRGTFRQ